MSTETIPHAVSAAVLSAPRGSYQSDLLYGSESWSGSTLGGKASNYADSYTDSRRSLVMRIRAALPEGWSAANELVLNLSRRWQRRLVLRGPDGEALDWANRAALAPTLDGRSAMRRA